VITPLQRKGPVGRRQFLAAGALAVAPSALAAPRRPQALVTADLEARLVVDLETGRARRTCRPSPSRAAAIRWVSRPSWRRS
jgi:hypothetical protein